MGLSERKTKQRLGADPRNLAWANDNARFGQQYLEKFGWTVGSGSGLGTSGQGRLSHISVAHKLNLLGIGGDNSNGDVSWKQNRDYELMLKRLNTFGGDDEGERIGVPVSVVPGGFVRAVEGTVTGGKGETDVATGEVDEEERKRLRKERKRKEKAAAKGKASVAHDGTTSCVEPSSATMDAASTVSPSQPAVPAKPSRRMPHRAKFRASKQLALSDAAALSEILGVSQSVSVVRSSGPSQTQSTLDTPADSPSPVPTPPTPTLQRPAGADDQIRTSTTSVADYFAAKMRARQQGAATPAIVAAATPPTAAAAAAAPAPPETVPEQDPEAQDAQEGTALVAGGVAGTKKEGKKRKRKDGVEKAETNRDGAGRHEESKKRRKKRKAE